MLPVRLETNSPAVLALLPACAGARVINCQDVLAYARGSLQATSLIGEDHQHA